MVNAVINGNRVQCGKCGSRLFNVHKKHIDITGVPDEVKEQVKAIPADVLENVKCCTVQIKCKAHKNGCTCNEINEVSL